MILVKFICLYFLTSDKLTSANESQSSISRSKSQREFNFQLNEKDVVKNGYQMDDRSTEDRELFYHLFLSIGILFVEEMSWLDFNYPTDV